MRIALFSECYRPVTNGVVTSVVTLRETLRACGHTVFVFAPGTPQPEDDEAIFRLPELPFPRHPYHFARPFQRLHVDFACLGAEIVHCHHPFTVGRLGADMARKHGLPMVYTAHSLYSLMVATSRSNLVRTMGQSAMRSVVRRFCARADYVIAPSRHTRDALRNDGIHARFAVVPSGVVPPAVHENGREATRRMLGISTTDPLILCVGRLGPEKRVDVLIRAMALLKQRNLPFPLSKFRLALVGDGQCRADLEELTEELNVGDRVIFVGAQPHDTIGDWYAAADVFAFSSPADTQGLVLVEAMLAGLPCIAADYGGSREVVVNNETGLRVPLRAEDFAAALEKLLRSPSECFRLGENGYSRARKVYSPEAMVQGVQSVYRSVLHAPRLPGNSSRTSAKFAVDRLRRRSYQSASRRA